MDWLAVRTAVDCATDLAGSNSALGDAHRRGDVTQAGAGVLRDA
jgi:hypothetical protein